MDLMYMCHVNFLPVNGGRIVQSLPWDSGHLAVRSSLPEHTTFSDTFADFLKRLESEPGLTSTIRPEDEYKPEVAFFMKNPQTDDDGWSHYLQVHPDGTADYVGYRPRELDHCTRWIMRTKDQEALGIALPATCDAEGYTAEKRKGALKQIPGKGRVEFHIRAGVLDGEGSSDMEKKIEKMQD